MKDKFLWVEKYRPDIIEDCILPDSIKDIFQGYVNQGEIPNLLLSGRAGVGKTTIAKALCNELGASYIVINGSDEGRFLDTIRNKVRKFATSVSLTAIAKHKVVIIDEADNTTQDVQLCLRNAIEEFHGNCRFIFTCNFANKILEPLHSRCSVVEFVVPKDQALSIQQQFLQRLDTILTHEEIEYDVAIVAKLLKRYYPDWRRLLNEVQSLSTNGKIGVDALAHAPEISIEALFGYIAKKDYTNVREWVVNNLNNDFDALVNKVYRSADTYYGPVDMGNLVLICEDYQRSTKDCANLEIHMLAFFTEIMFKCKVKQK